MASKVAAPALNYVVFYVANLDDSYRFFGETLGFTHQPEGDAPGFRQFDGGGMGIGLSQVREGTPPPGAVELYLKADDLPALREAWLANGVEAGPIVQMPFGKIFEIATPDGRRLTALG
jgi:catechol 2,3-dioxygenase-like lactoylglutathione lyase family enzyme